MKVDNIKPHGPFHLPRWSECDRVPSQNDVWTHGYADQSLVDAVVWTTKGAMTPVTSQKQCCAR